MRQRSLLVKTRNGSGSPAEARLGCQLLGNQRQKARNGSGNHVKARLSQPNVASAPRALPANGSGSPVEARPLTPRCQRTGLQARSGSGSPVEVRLLAARWLSQRRDPERLREPCRSETWPRGSPLLAEERSQRLWEPGRSETGTENLSTPEAGDSKRLREPCRSETREGSSCLPCPAALKAAPGAPWSEIRMTPRRCGKATRSRNASGNTVEARLSPRRPGRARRRLGMTPGAE